MTGTIQVKEKMYDDVYLSECWIEFVNAKQSDDPEPHGPYEKSHDFINNLHCIKNYCNFFDKLEVDGSIEDGDCYILTYDNCSRSAYYGKGLYCNEIKELMENISKLCNQYGYLFDATVKVFDDGDIVLYLIVHDNQVNDITDKINKVIEEEKSKIMSTV
jgi:hypothetical protein